jgi:catechol 2,3-dioxygenase-like lactoylglutathione lyase family enzyme
VARLHHVNVTCHPDDTQTVAAFYRDVLRLTPVEKAAGTDPAGAWFTIDATSQVHLSEREAPAHPDAHFALVVDDFPGLVERLERGGHEWQTAPQIFGAGRGFTRDPAGNRIEVLEAAGSTA